MGVILPSYENSRKEKIMTFLPAAVLKREHSKFQIRLTIESLKGFRSL
jgi:hypothetical protein